LTKEQRIILLADVIENKVRKEKELEFYEEELKKLQEKMYWLRRDIDVTNIILDMIKNETVIDLKEQAEEKLLIKPGFTKNADDV
jgi:hypothetical protein